MDNYYVQLDGWIEIKITGSQTIEYLNGIITRDLNKIDENTFVRSAFLTPNAKVRSVYWLSKEDGGVKIYCPAHMKEFLIEDLLKYKLSMDVKLEDVTEETPPLYLVTSEERIPGLSTDRFGFTFSHQDSPPDGTELSYDEFVNLLVQHGVTPPVVMTDQNPYELGIDDVISLEKGCFLGQEPISRMYHRGNPRKYIYQITFENNTEEQSITQDGEEVGEVLISTQKESHNIGLAYLRRTLESHDNLQLGDQPVNVVERVGTYPKNDR